MLVTSTCASWGRTNRIGRSSRREHGLRWCSFVLHVRRGLFQSDENADYSAFAVEGSYGVADVAGFDLAALDPDGDAFCSARIVVNKNFDAVDAFVRALLSRSPICLPPERSYLNQR